LLDRVARVSSGHSVRVPVYIALLHAPMTNRRGELITTSVTNLDIHDLARSARTYEVLNYFIVTPISDQRALVERILGHWSTGRSQEFHPDRVEAVSRVRVVSDFSEVKAQIKKNHGQFPEVVLTDARPLAKSVSYSDYRKELESRAKTGSDLPQPVVSVFGTGWGIAESFYPEVHRILAPVYGPGGSSPATDDKSAVDGFKDHSQKGYNHLSVRAAVAIILDRLFGQ
jgi:hypothetical protein